MARSRNIKHGLYLNEELAELSIYARYLFPCLWCLADKNGRMEYRPKKIKAEAYPYDDVDIPGLLIELHEKKFISVYGHGTRAYIQISNWAKHQNPHPKEKPSPVPPIDDEESIVATIGFSEEREKKFIFTAEPRPDHEKPHRTSDVLIPDMLIPDAGEDHEDPAAPTRTKVELIFLEVFAEKAAVLKKTFPQHDFEVVKEGCLAHFRLKPPPIDPYNTIYKWFQRQQSSRPKVFDPGCTDSEAKKLSEAEETKAYYRSLGHNV